RAGAARMRIIRLYDDAGKIGLVSEPMTEAGPPDGARWALEPLLELPALRLVDAARDAGRDAAHLRGSPAYAAAQTAARARTSAGDLLYYGEAFDERLRAIVQRGGGAPRSGGTGGGGRIRPRRPARPDDDSHDSDSQDPDIEHDLSAFPRDERTTPWN